MYRCFAMIWEADILYKHLEFHTTTVYKVALINGSVMVQWKKACPISIEVIYCYANALKTGECYPARNNPNIKTNLYIQ